MALMMNLECQSYNNNMENKPKEYAKDLVWKYYHILEHTISDEYLEQVALTVKNNIDTEKLFSTYATMSNTLSEIKSKYNTLWTTKESIPQMKKEISEYGNYVDIWVKRLRTPGLTSEINKFGTVYMFNDETFEFEVNRNV